MGLLKDVSDVIRDLKAGLDDMGTVEYAKRLRGSSIARKGAEGTLQFPMLVSKSLDIDTAVMIGKALERQYASFVQTTLSLHPYLDLSKDKDISSYLKNFHQNAGGRFNTLGDLLLEDSYTILTNEDESIGGLFILTEGSNPYIVKNNKEQTFCSLDYINENCLNELYKPKDPLVNFKNPDLNHFFNNRLFNENKIVTEAENIVQKQDRDMEYKLHALNVQNRGNAAVRLTDNDCKKANELVPTTLAVSLNVKDKGNFGGTVNFVIGVKTILHPVTSDEMVRNLVNGFRNGNKFFKFIRWTTGELNFVKDFLLNMTEIREDVVSQMSAKESGWWTVLKRRQKAAKAKRILPTGKEILPNASIVLTVDEVEMMRSEYGFNLNDTNQMIKLMREYFLLSLVIVDPAQELATFMFDGQNQPQVMSFSGLERDNSSKNDFKEMYKLINSGRL